MLIDYYPAESHLVTFRDKASFPLLYHPACNSLVPDHIATLAQKVAAVSCKPRRVFREDEGEQRLRLTHALC